MSRTGSTGEYRIELAATRGAERTRSRSVTVTARAPGTRSPSPIATAVGEGADVGDSAGATGVAPGADEDGAPVVDRCRDGRRGARRGVTGGGGEHHDQGEEET